MKKLLVLVVAVLAMASLASMAHADTIIFQDSWAYAFATWQGSNQDTYPADPHAIVDAAVLSPFTGETGNYVARMTYNKTQEAWSGHLTAASPGANLSGVTRLQFQVRSDDTMNVPVVINKVVVNDSNNAALTIRAGFEAPLGSWSTVQSDAGTFDGRNMAAVTMPFGFYMGDTDNVGITGDNCIFYFDNVKFVGGSTGTVRVTLTSGVVGVQIEQSVNFDLITGGITTNTSYNSADIMDDTQNHFIVTNKGTDACYYRVYLINPGGWTAVNPTAPANTINLTTTDTYALYGQFAQPGASVAGDMSSYAALDGITTSAKAAAAGTLDFSGLGDGYNVAANAARNLWIALHTPPTTSVGSTQQITVVVSAVKL
ncbi:MAG: hypothetical protein PHH44_02215 [bacterium]|nr:hypothetical protein [bacterium]